MCAIIDRTYNQKVYWNEVFRGDVNLATVAHKELGAYNWVAYKFRLRAFRQALYKVALSLPGVWVFEVGFGVGFYLKYWQQMGVKQVTGIDVSKVAVIRAQQKFPQFNLFEADITEPLSLDERTFDLCTAIDVLYHIVDDRLWGYALDNLGKVLKPGGYLILTDKFPRSGVFQNAPHVRRRSLEIYHAALAHRELEVVAVFPVFVFMDDPIACGEQSWMGELSYWQWRGIQRAIRLFTRWPIIRDCVAVSLAACSAPFEWLALSLLRRSSNLEMVIAKKR